MPAFRFTRIYLTDFYSLQTYVAIYLYCHVTVCALHLLGLSNLISEFNDIPREFTRMVFLNYI